MEPLKEHFNNLKSTEFRNDPGAFDDLHFFHLVCFYANKRREFAFICLCLLLPEDISARETAAREEELPIISCDSAHPLAQPDQ
jgi:hypothetical protein